MSLSLNEILLLVITIAVVAAVFFLIPVFIQIKKTMKEGEKSLEQIKELAQELKDTSSKIHPAVENASEMVESAKKTAVNLSEITWLIATRIVRPSSRYWPFIFPFLRLGWRQIKKKKGGKKNVR